MAFSPAKRMILAIGAAGIAATGAIAGAQYKSEREKEMAKAIVARDLQVATESESVAQTTVPVAEHEDILIGRIAALEGLRAQLLMQRHGIQKKLEAFEGRKELSDKKESIRNEAKKAMESKK